MAKANEAIFGMMGQLCLEPGKVKAVSVRRLHSGGVVYELDSPSTVALLCRESDSFTARFSGMSIVRDKAIPVIVKYVPISYNTDALAENNKIEHDSGIGEGALTSMKWVKPVHKRVMGQWMAHLVAQFSSVDLANHTIWDSVILMLCEH